MPCIGSLLASLLALLVDNSRDRVSQLLGGGSMAYREEAGFEDVTSLFDGTSMVQKIDISWSMGVGFAVSGTEASLRPSGFSPSLPPDSFPPSLPPSGFSPSLPPDSFPPSLPPSRFLPP